MGSDCIPRQIKEEYSRCLFTGVEVHTSCDHGNKVELLDEIVKSLHCEQLFDDSRKPDSCSVLNHSCI